MSKFNALYVGGGTIPLYTKSTSTIQHKTKDLTFEFKASADEENIIEGYASTFGGEPDSYGDVIEMGAFAKTIKERSNDIKFLWQHNWNEPIGKITEIHEDAKGLFIKVKVSATQRGLDAMKLIKDGVINKMSIGYSVIKDEYDREKSIRYLKELKLYEVSAVTFPANSNAVITGAKNENLEASLKSFIAETVEEIKAGKVLSEKNKKAVEEAVEALGKAADSLNALLEATEGPKSDDDDPKKAPGADDRSKSLVNLIAEFTQKAEAFKQ